MATPASLFHVSQGRPADASALDKIDRSSDDWVTRKVTAVGVITVAHQQISVGKLRAGRIVDVHIGHLRQKLGDPPAAPRYILTVRGFGYRFADRHDPPARNAP